MTTTSDIEILLTSGDVYKLVTSAPGVYTGEIAHLGVSGISTALRGDLAACNDKPTALPVTFVSFTARENDCNVKYSWIVAQEQNVNNYQLQLINNYGAFTSITEIKATNSSLNHSYSYTTPITNKIMFARVKQTDNDNKVAYSVTVSTNTTCTTIKNISIINSSSILDKVQIQWNNFATPQTMSVSIYNAYGAQIAKQQIAVSSFTTISKIDLGNISAGTYYISASASNGDKYSVNFIKK